MPWMVLLTQGTQATSLLSEYHNTMSPETKNKQMGNIFKVNILS